MSEQKRTVGNRADRTETGQQTGQQTARPVKTSKDQLSHWKRRLRKRSYLRDGRNTPVTGWQVRVFYAGRESWFNTGTENRDAAASKARDFYESLTKTGWEPTLAKFKPAGPGESRDGAPATVGEYLDKVRGVAPLRATTFKTYSTKFRTLVAGVFHLHGGKEKFNYRTGGNAKWLARVNRIRLHKITPQRIQAWKVKYLAAAANPLALKHAQTTVNSIIRGAKALFAPAIVKHLPGTIPSPFAGVENVRLPKNRYKSEFNPQLLLVQAARELKPTHPEEFKVLLLALGAGLRRDEIDTLTWSMIDYGRNQITVETTVHTSAKTEDSENAIDVDPGLLEILKEYMATSQSEFVINSKVAPRPNANWHHYRCSRVFANLIAWLRSKGIKARNCLHVLRKEFGSQICAQAGIYAASRALRHSNIALTAAYYTDKKVPTVFAVSSMLKSPPTVAPETKEGAA